MTTLPNKGSSSDRRSVKQLAVEVALVRTRDAVPHDAIIPVIDDRIPNLPPYPARTCRCMDNSGHLEERNR